MRFSTILSLTSLATAAPVASASDDYPAVSTNAYNFVLSALNTEHHMKPVNVDDSGKLTIANGTHLTLKFDDAGHAIDPFSSKQLNLTDIIYQAEMVEGTNTYTGLGVKDGVLVKEGMSSWGMCPNDDGGFNIYWVYGESPCHNMVGPTLVAVPIYLLN